MSDEEARQVQALMNSALLALMHLERQAVRIELFCTLPTVSRRNSRLAIAERQIDYDMAVLHRWWHESRDRSYVDAGTKHAINMAEMFAGDRYRAAKRRLKKYYGDAHRDEKGDVP